MNIKFLVLDSAAWSVSAILQSLVMLGIDDCGMGARPLVREPASRELRQL